VVAIQHRETRRHFTGFVPPAWLRPVVALVVWLMVSQVGRCDPLGNGDFSEAGSPPEPFARWTTELTLGDPPSDGGGFALFAVSDLPDAEQLEQTFSLPAGASRLSFELQLEVEGNDPGGAIRDSFQVTLYGAGFTPLLPFNEFSPAFYSVENDGSALFDPAFVTVSALDGGFKRVELDISTLPPQDVLLELLLIGGEDGRQTTVVVDNVEVTMVPEPSGLALGICLAGGLVGGQVWAASSARRRSSRPRIRRSMS
jgi:hypothetical protein